MSFFKIAGALAVIVSGFVMSYIMNSEATEKWKQSEALISFMRYIKIQIECFALPASEIISRCDAELLASCGFHAQTRPEKFERLFELCVISDAETKEILSGFAAGFGKGYREEQIKECEYYIELLCERREKLYEELPKKKKLNSTLCVSAAFAIVILFL